MVIFVNNNFSAFKLFYDEFVYKKNNYVSYAKVEENLERINKALNVIRKCSKLDVKSYMKKLNASTKEIKTELEEILKKNKKIMEYYSLIYSSIINFSNDSIKDFPLIISTSFYNDYRIDNKKPLELESNSNTIPKYSSLEKKYIRIMTKNKPCLVYFVELLRKSVNSKKYDFFLEKMDDVVFNLYPLYSENHFMYISRVTKNIEGFEKIYKKLEDKVKLSDDYEDIYLKIKIAYRKKMIDWVESIKEMVNEYFDSLFHEKQTNFEAIKHLNIVNTISYSSYLEILNEMKEEKKRFDEQFKDGTFSFFSSDTTSYLFRFKYILINSFYDKRYHLNIIKGDMRSYVNAAISLYSLAVDLENNIIDYYLYLASHSKRLLRNNDVESAIISNLYNLYSPLDCLDRFENERNAFSELLNAESDEFKKKYNTELLEKRAEFDFKGMIPTVSAIKIKLNEKCKNFIVENCLDNIINYDETGLYDTRNYDLEVLCQKLSFEDIVDLYGKLKSVFNNIENSLAIPQRFICTVIYNRLGYDVSNNRESKMTEICNTYLKEDPVFL